MRSARRGRLAALGVAFVAIIAAAACQPIENAPPGGGEVIVQKYRIGPFNLSPAGQSGSESESFRANVPRPSGAFGLKSINFDIVDTAGNPVAHSAVHLHHVVMMNPARQSMYCSNWPERFAASGSERTPMALPDPYAYMVGANERWDALWHVMNESDQAREVYIEYTVGYQPGATAQNSRPVTPFFLDVTGCGNSEYTVPGGGGPDSVHENTRTWSVPWDGYIVGAGGHVHGGGINIGLREEDTGYECTMRAIYDHHHGHGAPSQMTACPIHYRVDQGEQFSVVSRYNNESQIPGAMGIVLAYAWQGTQ